MSKKEQIEKMAKDLQKSEHWRFNEHSIDFEIDRKKTAENLYNANYRKIPENIGEFSDGYHTFNELYHHRAVLFSVICNMFPEKSWKSKLHDTGDMYDGMFIVGIETEQGQATYHYDIEPYWDMFKVKELEKAPKYDGHTPSDAIARIGSIGYRKQSEWISVEDRLPEFEHWQTIVDVPFPIPTPIKVLCAFQTKDGYIIREGTYEINDGLPYFRVIGRVAGIVGITHWMPLPEAPKMKGGEEQ